jgi:hypothetical protein
LYETINGKNIKARAIIKQIAIKKIFDMLGIEKKGGGFYTPPKNRINLLQLL